MRRISTLLILLIGTGVSAQTWCAPGAEWTYGFANQQASGITHAWYSGDSLLGGYNAQRIDQTIHAYQPVFPFGQAFTQELVPLFTRTENGVVYIWDQLSVTYDTLMWFAAVPGQRWNLHHQDGSTWFNVLDTGTSVVQGIPLHFLVVEEPNFLFATDTLRERIGSDLFYIDPMETLLIDWTTGWLHCYRDNAIDAFHGTQWTWSVDCDFTVGLPEATGTMSLPFPNPGSDQFTVQLPGGMHTVELFDATGRRVLSESTVDANVRIGTEALPSGAYFVRVTDALGSVGRSTWMKE